MSKALKEQALKMKARISLDKNITQKVRLATNQIAPDNFEKKFGELREHIFGDMKLSNEPGYDPEIHKPIEQVEN